MGRLRFIVLGPTDRKRKDGTPHRTSAIVRSVHAFSLFDQAHALKVAHRRIILATQERPSEDLPNIRPRFPPVEGSHSKNRVLVMRGDE